MEVKEKGHDKSALAYALTETGEDSNGRVDPFAVGEIVSGIRERSIECGNHRTPLPTSYCGNQSGVSCERKVSPDDGLSASSADPADIPPSSKRYMSYLSGLLPLAYEINRLQDPDGAVMTARNEAEVALGRVGTAEEIMADAYVAIVGLKVPFVNSFTESGRAKWLRERATVVLAVALKKIEAATNEMICSPIDWPELEDFDVRGSMPVSDVDHMADDLARITESLNEAIAILNEHLDSATELRDESRARFDEIKQQLQEAVEELTDSGEMSALDIYETIDRLQN